MSTSTSKRKTNGSATHHAMSARLLELSAETNLPDPYPVTDTIVIQPPTRTRRKAMYEAEMTMYMTRRMLAQALRDAAEPAPTPPAEQDVTEEQRAEFDVLHADWAARMATHQGRIDSINSQVQAASDDYDRAFFGEDMYQAVIDYFEDKPTLWDLFMPDIKSEFLPKAPSDGTCRECGQIVDEDAAGKALASST